MKYFKLERGERHRKNEICFRYKPIEKNFLILISFNEITKTIYRH